MAQFKHDAHFYQVESGEFDKLYTPGGRIAWSGIYRCKGCGCEVVHTFDKPLPPQSHHHHTLGQGAIQWQLIVTDSPDPS
jgi:hypothetical protein